VGSPPGGTGAWTGTGVTPAEDWRLPVDGRLTVLSGFDPPEQRWQAGHRGVDLLSRPGAVVRSAGAGRVSFAGSIGGLGSVAVTHADGTRTTYQPLVPGVRKGDLVDPGSPLGRLAVAGGHCLPATCLHWGRLRGQVYLDPLLLVRRGPPRLLPVWSSS
jgi:murein DD-endopeptidase MepM/ murein hydrolase activator NlpD